MTPAERLQELHASSLRLLGLLTAHEAEETLLRYGIESLTALIGARYGAIGILDDAGQLKQFVYTGLSAEEAARIGTLPEGRGLLGAVIHDDEALRLDDVARDPRSVGFPPHHPPMKSLLAVRVAHEDHVYGRIYLSEKTGGPFTDEDERLVRHFAETVALTLRFHRTDVLRRRTETLLHDVAQAVSTVTGEEFFRVLAVDLANALQMDFAFIGEVSPHNERVIQTLAFCNHGQIADNVEYQLVPQTACGSVRCKAVCYLPENAQALYPEDEILREFDVQAFVGQPLLDADGKVLGLLAVMHTRPVADVAYVRSILQIAGTRAAVELERRRTTAALRASEEKLRGVVDHAPVCIHTLDLEGRVTGMNSAGLAMLGLQRPEQVLGTRMLAAVSEPDRARVAALFRRAVQGEASEFEFTTTGGRVFASSFHPVRDPAGRIEYLIGVTQDVTARKSMEGERQRLSSAIEQTADSVLITNREGVIEYVNPAFEAKTGYARHEAVGQKPNLVRSGLHDDAFYKKLWETIEQGKPFYGVFINRKKDGTLYFEEKTIAPLKDEHGRITHFVSTGKDITERVVAEEENRHIQRFLDSVVDNLPNMVFVKTAADLKYVRINKAGEELLGYARDGLIGKTVYDFFPPDEADFFTSKDREVLAGGRLLDIPEEPIHTKTKGVRILHTKKIPIPDAAGHPLYLLGISEDITERKQAEEALARAASEWTYSMDFMEDALYLIDLDDQVVRANRAFYRLTGLSPERVIGRDITSLMHPQGETTPCPVCVARRERRDATIVMEADHPDNPTGRPIEVMVRIVRDAENRPASVLMGIRDLTRARQVEADLLQSRAKLLEAQRMAHLGNWELSLVENTLTWSDEIYRIFEIDPAKFDASYEVFLDAIHPDDRELVDSAYAESIRNKTPYDIEHRLLMKDGRIKYVHECGETFYDDRGKPLRSVGTVQDVTERKRAEEQLNYLAFYDSLTGLPNRTLLLDRLNQAMLDASRVDRLVAIMFLDLDRFKYINDTLGHQVGDALLKAVAERLKACVRPGDIISRLGGDEFTVVLSNVAHVDDIARVARKILDCFTQSFTVDRRELFTTTSIGITIYPFDDRDAEGLLKNADAAMYHAKEQGRNTIRFFTSELNVRAERRLQLEIALRTALERNELSLHYQPQVDLRTGRINGMEALLRWNHPRLGQISPVEFIPVAEETGLILPIGEWVLREACRQIKHWHAAGFPALQVAVNLSGKQLRQRDFPKLVKTILRETGLPARHLDLELTESLLMTDVDEIATAMQKLHKLGVSFSVDDFGTGYSSLAYLKRFPIDVLKIDRSFVRDLANDPNDLAIVKTIIAMAHTLGMHVIAEGVETYEQLAFLRGQGCDGSQGYYCSEPLDVNTFTEMLRDWNRMRANRCRPKARTPTARRPRRRAKRRRART